MQCERLLDRFKFCYTVLVRACACTGMRVNFSAVRKVVGQV